jgi:hypothetical protein
MEEIGRCTDHTMNIETVKCDNIPLPISRIGLGTWAIGGWMWGGSDEAESIKTIQHAVDARADGYLETGCAFACHAAAL